MTTGSVIRGENERDERSGSQAGLKKKCISHDIHNCGFLAFFWSFFFFFSRLVLNSVLSGPWAGRA